MKTRDRLIEVLSNEEAVLDPDDAPALADVILQEMLEVSAAPQLLEAVQCVGNAAPRPGENVVIGYEDWKRCCTALAAAQPKVTP